MKNLSKTILLLGVMTILLISSISTAFATDKTANEISAGCIVSLGEKTVMPIVIQNNDSIAHNYHLNVGVSVNSYESFFASNGAPIKDINVPATTSIPIDFNITLNKTASVMADKVVLKIVRDDGKENLLSIPILINKDFTMSINSMLDKATVLSGKSAEITFVVKNTGSKNLTSVQILSTLPYKWMVSKGSDFKINLKPGESGTIKLTIDVPSSQVSGNFVAKFTASSDETKSIQIAVPVTVKTAINIGFWAFGILIVIAGFTFVQFRRHGRR